MSFGVGHVGTVAFRWMGSTSANQRDRAVGALLGLACGDAVGTTVEFAPRGTFEPLTDMVGGGPFRLAVGAWTDDTSMAMCLAESILDRGGLDASDQLRRYLLWFREGYWSSTDRCFDIGATTASALRRFETTGASLDATIDEDAAANGSLMRLAPVASYTSYSDVHRFFKTLKLVMIRL